jgi:UDP-N-acetylglucosamine 4-epimerase
LSNYKFLITGGAGFIGSNLVEYLLRNDAGLVRVLDDFSNGYFDNIKSFVGLSNFEIIEGDIRNIDVCKSAVTNIDYISHQAALGSVPRSIGDPLLSNSVNVDGFLNMLVAAKESDCLKKFVYAASSSTYGDSAELPKIEGSEGKPLSPYAVTKVVNELYADVFSKVYSFHSIGLRYFNVFGPKQNPDNPYAAVIPLFCKKILSGKSPEIFGDGTATRDFTFIENAIQANIKAFEFEPTRSEIFNIAYGKNISLNQIVSILNYLNQSSIQPIYMGPRAGDIKDSLASIEKANRLLDYNPKFDFEKGLEIVFDWYKKYL